ncbi:hypothetical protein BV921_08275 [Pectobacterium odoriferum]|uniref:Uncharacterized protein n=1 Tax=Pectobacterium odoriferum TaxID=78398 RepID=A0ABD6VLC6_9GAMM|nr:hypothetical protein BV925_21800 [Pectobacterium odoriferum]POD90925.1 hypothetical protein BVY06_22450 [Pectobacterium odoriferum]POE06308.1 hypothetical protein BV916_00015 [Pectobacterium odoriferum]POE07705.1 hypothetical protein BV924_22700 [Pectobacterium odoriferum]POE11020.1 hypothetical protein BV921_08275 [Pectobacterium odoriferum]
MELPLLKESDIEVLLARKVALLVCAPWLKYQFHYQGFDKSNMIWSGVMEYVSMDTSEIINKINALVTADT